MTPHELALARARAYQLFGGLFLHGLTAGDLPRLEALPELGDLLPQPFEADVAAAAHYRLTTAVILPYESILRDPAGLLGGPVAEQVAARYRQSGYDAGSDPDHIAHELLFLAHLCAAETAAWQQGDGTAASLWQARQQGFLAAHLLAWLPPFVAAVQLSDLSFYGRLAGLTLELAAAHLAAAPPSGPAFILPAAPALAAGESGLKDIAGFLLTPPYSGFFLGRDAISDLARRRQLPRGFGDRRQLLTNLLRAAGQYDLATAVLGDLVGLCRRWQEIYTAQGDVAPNLAPWLRPWQERLAQTGASLDNMTALLLAA